MFIVIVIIIVSDVLFVCSRWSPITVIYVAIVFIIIYGGCRCYPVKDYDI